MVLRPPSIRAAQRGRMERMISAIVLVVFDGGGCSGVQVFQCGGGGEEGRCDDGGFFGGDVAHAVAEFGFVCLCHGLHGFDGEVPAFGGAFDDGFECHLLRVGVPGAFFSELLIGFPGVGAVADFLHFFAAHAFAEGVAVFVFPDDVVAEGFAAVVPSRFVGDVEGAKGDAPLKFVLLVDCAEGYAAYVAAEACHAHEAARGGNRGYSGDAGFFVFEGDEVAVDAVRLAAHEGEGFASGDEGGRLAFHEGGGFLDACPEDVCQAFAGHEFVGDAFQCGDD